MSPIISLRAATIGLLHLLRILVYSLLSSAVQALRNTCRCTAEAREIYLSMRLHMIRKTRIIGFCTFQYLRLASAQPLLAEISCSAMSRPSVPCIIWAELVVMFPHTQVYPCAHRGYDCVFVRKRKIRGLGGILYVAHHVVCRSHDNASLSFIPGS